MTHWDGLASTNAHGASQRICILGATNRIQDIDEAILRRMPKKFPVSLPSAPQRRNIFQLILRDTKMDRANFDLDYLVRVSAGMSGSDIKEACRDAAMGPVREYIKKNKAAGTLGRGVRPEEVRGLRTEDFFGRRGGAHPHMRDQRDTEGIDADDRIVETESTTTEASSEASSEAGDRGDEFRDSAYQEAVESR